MLAFGLRLSITNTIVANSPTGGNCNNWSGSLTQLTSGGHNLSSDLSCTLTGTADANGFNPLLTGLGHYGGPTEVHLPKLGSPAIDQATSIGTTIFDQRHLIRPRGAGYDIGAVERQPDDYDLVPKVFLPAALR